MRVEFDRESDAVYIAFREVIGVGGVKKTYPCDPREVGGMINLDFDAEGRLVGVEVLDATRLLPDELLSQAE